MQSRGFAPILIIVSLLIVSVLVGGAFYLGKQQAPRPITPQPAIVASSQPLLSPSPSNSTSLSIKEIDYLSKYSSNNSGYDRTVFITMNEQSQDLKIADLEVTPGSVKTLYSIPLPGAMGFSTPIYSVGTYLVANISGGDAGDIMIFDSNGKTVAKSVYSDNPELDRWNISYKGESLGNIITINLFRLDNSQATATIDLKTGKIVPNSLTVK